MCSDGYFGDPQGLNGPQKPCLPCDCNTNVDPNAVGNCNRTTGECLKCIYNTAGSSCDQCKPGFYGDALAPLKGDCRQCQCYEPGTLGSEIGTPHCDQVTGQCKCRPHVHGRNCDFCQDGYFNIASGEVIVIIIIYYHLTDIMIVNLTRKCLIIYSNSSEKYSDFYKASEYLLIEKYIFCLHNCYFN